MKFEFLVNTNFNIEFVVHGFTSVLQQTKTKRLTKCVQKLLISQNYK